MHLEPSEEASAASLHLYFGRLGNEKVVCDLEYYRDPRGRLWLCARTRRAAGNSTSHTAGRRAEVVLLPRE
jgi:hypothetical protein